MTPVLHVMAYSIYQSKVTKLQVTDQKVVTVENVEKESSESADQEEVFRDLAHFFESQKKRIRRSKSILDEITPLIPHLDQDPQTGEKVKLTRERFSRSAVLTLRREYRANKRWSREHIKELANRLDYQEEKIYKWFNGKVNKDRRRW